LPTQFSELAPLPQNFGLVVALVDGMFQICPKLELTTHFLRGSLFISLAPLGDVLETPARLGMAGPIADLRQERTP
jgi:hypothetical protein